MSAASPLVSVVLPTRNRANSLGRAIESVLDQTYPHLELIVIDDGSTDSSSDVLRGYGRAITVLSQPPRGVYPARNLGLRRASGDLVAFADSDDAWRPDRLRSQVPLFERPEVGLVFGDALHHRPGSASGRLPLTSFRVTPPRRGMIAAHLARGNCIPTVTVLARRRCLEEMGGFAESHGMSADYLAWFRVALRYEVDYVDDVVADYTVHDAGISADLGATLVARIELFAQELGEATTPRARAAIRQLLASAALSLMVATARGRARGTDSPYGRAWAALELADPLGALRAAVWLGARKVSSLRRPSFAG